MKSTFTIILSLIIVTLFAVSIQAQIPTSGLRLHLKADAGTSSTTPGQKISQWNDQSGNGFHATEGNSTWQPTYVNDGGIPAVRFTPSAPTSMNLPRPSDMGFYLTNYEFFIVTKTSSTATQFPLAGGINYQEIQTSGASGARFIARSGNYIDNPARVDDGGFHILNAIGTTSEATLGVDGVFATLLTDATTSVDVAFNLGTRSDGFYRFDGDIAEVIMYNRKLSVSESMQVTEYLKNKYATPFTAYGAPQTQASGLNFTGVTQSSMNVNLTKGSGTHRVVVAKKSGAVSVGPTNGVAYSGSSSFGAGSHLGDGNYVIYAGTEGTSTALSGLEFNESYHFSVFEYYVVGGVPQYGSALNASQTTVDLTQASSLTISSRSADSFTAGVAAGSGTYRLIVARAGSAVNQGPSNGLSYTGNANYGSGTQIGTGNFVVYNGTDGSSFSLNALEGNMVYYLAAFEYQIYNGVPKYQSESPAVNSGITYPSSSANNVQFSSVGLDQMLVSFTAGNGQKRIVIGRESQAVSAAPSDGQTFSANTTFGNGQNLGSGNYVVYDGTGNSFTLTGLTNSTSYHFSVYEYNEYNGTINFKTTAPAVGSQSTTVVPLPTASIGNFSNYTSTSLTISGLANPNGYETTVSAVYGTDPGNLTSSTLPVSIGSGSVEVPVSIDLTGLTVGELYYVAIKATNIRGDVVSISKKAIPLTRTSMRAWFRADHSTINELNYVTNFENASGVEISPITMNSSTTVTNGINGKPSYNHPIGIGTGNGISISSDVLGIANSDLEVIIVFESSSNSKQHLMYIQDYNRISLNSSGYGVQGAFSFDDINHGTSNSFTNGNTQVLHYKTNATQSLLRINNEEASQVFRKNAFNSGTIRFGSDPIKPFIGKIAEIIIYNAELSFDQRLELSQYLAQRYAVPVYTPSVPTNAASAFQFSTIAPTSYSVSMDAGNGEERLIVARLSSSEKTPPVNGTSYTASTNFGSGSNLGNGNFVVGKGVGTSVNITGLSPNTEYTIDVYEYNVMELKPQYMLTSPNSVAQSTQAVQLASISGISAQQSTNFTMFINASVNPNGFATDAQVVFGTDAENLNLSSAVVPVGSQSSAQAVQLSATGLSVNTLYYYKVRATNIAGVAESEIETFTFTASAPTVSLNDVQQLNTTTPTITSRINPNGYSTSLQVFYGTSLTNLNLSTSAQVIGSQEVVQAVQTNLAGISTNTQYFYKVVATNVAGSTESEIGTFKYNENINLPSLKFWVAGDGGTNTINSGDPVNSWANQAGQAIKATQELSQYKPTRITESGISFLRFDGDNSIKFMEMGFADSLQLVNSEYEIFIVAKSSSTNIGFLIGGTVGNFELHTRPGGGVGTRFIPKSGIILDNTINTTDGNFHIINAKATSTQAELRIDGNSTVVNGDARSSIASQMLIGARRNGSFPFDGDIAEIIIFNSNLSLNESALISEFLATKYSITLTPFITPTLQASSADISAAFTDSVTVSVSNGNGTHRLFVMREQTTAAVAPTQGVVYAANRTYGEGSITGVGNFVIAATTSSSATAKGLAAIDDYIIDVYEYNAAGSNPRYLTISPASVFYFNALGNTGIPRSSLKLWFSAGRGVQTGANSVVTSWRELSGLDNNTEQSVEGYQPTLVEDAINSQPAVHFNGSTSYLVIPQSADLGLSNSNYEIFIVGKSSSAATQFLISGGLGEQEIHLNGSSGVRFIPTAGKLVDAGTIGQFTNDEPFLLNMKATNTLGSTRINNSLLGTLNQSTQSSADNQMVIGTRTGGTFWYDGDIAEIIFYNKELSVSARDSVHNFLATKYGITLETVSEPTVAASNSVLLQKQPTSLQFSATKGNGAKRLVLAKANTAVDAIPVDNTVYSANSTFGSGSEIGSGNFVVYSGTDSVFTISGLTAATTYHFALIEFNGELEPNYLSSLSTASIAKTLASIPIDLASTSLHFGGGDEHILIPFNEATQSNSNITIEAWIKPSSNTAYAQIVGNIHDTVVEESGYGLMLDGSNGLLFAVKTASSLGSNMEYLPSGGGITLNMWHHVAATYDGITKRIYINGREVAASTNGSGTIHYTPINNIRIGRYEDDDEYYNYQGELDEVRIWNDVRTTQEIREFMFTSISSDFVNLVTYYQFNEGTGTTTIDAASGLNGTLTNFEFDVNNGWRNSGIPFGAGTFSASDAVSSGTINASGLDLTLTENFDNPVSVVSKQFTVAPLVEASGNTINLNNPYWVVETPANAGAFEASLTFTVPSSFASSGAPLPNQFKLYSRPFGSDGAWSVLKSIAASVTSTTVTFNGVSQFGQFVLARDFTYDFDANAGKSVLFDGTNDFASIPVSSGLTSTKLTMEFWFKWNRSGTALDFITSRSGEEWEIHLGAGSNGIRFIPRTGVYIDTPADAIVPGQWTHLAVVYDPSVSLGKIYVNGADATGDNVIGSLPLATPLLITSNALNLGRRQVTGDLNFSGEIDEFRVWNSARTQQQIQENMNRTLPDDYYSDLVMYFQFNEGSGTSTSEIQSGLTGTLTNFDFNQNSGWVNSLIPITQEITTDIVLTGTEGWRLLASPISANSYSPLLSSIWTQGFEGATTTSGSSNVFVWPTSATGNSSSSWTPLTTMNSPMQAGSGVLVYVYSDDNGPEEGNAGFPKTISISGTETVEDKNLSSLLNQNVGGWTLLGNPFSKDINWNNLSRNGLAGSVYVWDNDSLKWRTWNGSTGGLTNGHVGAFNGFFVETTNSNPTFTIPQNARIDGNNGFIGKSVANNPIALSLELKTKSGLSNQAWFEFTDDGQTGKDDGDTYKLAPLSYNWAQLASVSKSVLNEDILLDINSLPVNQNQWNIPLAISSTEFGEHELSIQTHSLPEGWKVRLWDTFQEISIDLNDPFVFELEENVNAAANEEQIEEIITDEAGQQSKKTRSESDVRTSAQKTGKVAAKASQKNAEKNKTGPEIQSGNNLSGRYVLQITKGEFTDNGNTELPTQVELSQNYPNPFNPSTTIQFALPENAQVRLDVFDITGRLIKTVVNEVRTAGYHSVQINASALSSGMYFYRLRTAGKVVTKKMMLIK